MNVKQGALVAAMLLSAGPTVLRAQQEHPADTSHAAQDELIARGRADGDSVARTLGRKRWLTGGFVGGALTAWVGLGIAVAIAQRPTHLTAKRRAQIASAPPEYQSAFEAAYRRKWKSRRTHAAALGGVLGTALLIGLYKAAGGF